MTSLLVIPPYKVWPDVDGEPLEDGYIYVGQVGLNPETNPVPVFFDQNLTIPAAQPLRTIGGFISNAGTPANVFTNGQPISQTVRNKNNTLVYTNLFVPGASEENSTTFELNSVDDLINSSGLTSYGQIYLRSYDEVLYPNAEGPLGGHKVHPTGGTNAAPSKGAPTVAGTIGVGAQSGYYFDQNGNEWVISTDQEIDSSMFNVSDNSGTTEMGAQLEHYFNYINNVSGDHRIDVNFKEGIYLITGGTNQAAPGFGVVEGLIPLSRDNLTLNLENVEFKVPDDFYWERTAVGGDANDHFARGLYISGANAFIYGGILNGNLRNRTIIRGPTSNNYGGNEVGFRPQLGSNGLRAYGLISKEWGTDCHYQESRDCKFYDCEFIAGRRLCSAIVGEEIWTQADPVEFYDCLFSEAATYDDADYNRPASGVDIESDGAFPGATNFHGCTFKDNRKYNIQLSSGAQDCIFSDCDFHGATQSWSIGALELIFNSFNKQPAAAGGHLWEGNRFHDGQYLETIYGTAAEDPSYVIGNWFKDAAAAVTFRTDVDYPPGWDLFNNNVPGVGGASVVAGTNPNPQNEAGNITAYTIGLENQSQYEFTGNLALGASSTLTLTDLVANGLILDNGTYEFFAKMNNGNGDATAHGRYLFSFTSGVLEGLLVLSEVASAGRSIVYGAGDIVFTSASFASTYGYIVNRIGDDFGT